MKALYAQDQLFCYNGVNHGGVRIAGILNAPSEAAAREELERYYDTVQVFPAGLGEKPAQMTSTAGKGGKDGGPGSGPRPGGGSNPRAQFAEKARAAAKAEGVTYTPFPKGPLSPSSPFGARAKALRAEREKQQGPAQQRALRELESGMRSGDAYASEKELEELKEPNKERAAEARRLSAIARKHDPDYHSGWSKEDMRGMDAKPFVFACDTQLCQGAIVGNQSGYLIVQGLGVDQGDWFIRHPKITRRFPSQKEAEGYAVALAQDAEPKTVEVDMTEWLKKNPKAIKPVLKSASEEEKRRYGVGKTYRERQPGKDVEHEDAKEIISQAHRGLISKKQAEVKLRKLGYPQIRIDEWLLEVGKDQEIAMDPLTSKGNKIMSAMTKQYGPEKGKQVFYASRNAGKISGVDAEYPPPIRNGDYVVHKKSQNRGVVENLRPNGHFDIRISGHDILLQNKTEDDVEKSKYASRNAGKISGVDAEMQEEDEFNDGDRVRLKPPYAEASGKEVFRLSQVDPDRERAWIGDKQGRGWYVRFSQIEKV
jgi:hypothetical protein